MEVTVIENRQYNLNVSQERVHIILIGKIIKFARYNVTYVRAIKALIESLLICKLCAEKYDWKWYLSRRVVTKIFLINHFQRYFMVGTHAQINIGNACTYTHYPYAHACVYMWLGWGRVGDTDSIFRCVEEAIRPRSDPRL
jgi:hypothetical protein